MELWNKLICKYLTPGCVIRDAFVSRYFLACISGWVCVSFVYNSIIYSVCLTGIRFCWYRFHSMTVLHREYISIINYINLELNKYALIIIVWYLALFIQLGVTRYFPVFVCTITRHYCLKRIFKRPFIRVFNFKIYYCTYAITTHLYTAFTFYTCIL